MPVLQSRKINPRLYTNVLEAIAELKENGGSHIRSIINHIQSSLNNIANGESKTRNVTLQVRRAIKHGVAEGMLTLRGGRVRITFGSKNANVGRNCCGFIYRKEKKTENCGKDVRSKRGRRKGRGKNKVGKGSKKGSKGNRGGGDPCAPKQKSGRVGKSRRRSSKCAAAPKRKKKARRAKKPKECNMQQYSDENAEEDVCTWGTGQKQDDRNNSHVIFADEDQICDNHQQSIHHYTEHAEKIKRTNQPPTRTSRQIREGTPKHLDRLNPDFFPEHDDEAITGNEHVPRSCNRKKDGNLVRYNQNTDYINKNFDNNDIHGISHECDNPDCLCNINQDLPDICTGHSPQRFSDRRHTYRDPNHDIDRDHDTDRDRHPDPDRDRDADPDRDRDADPDRDPHPDPDRDLHPDPDRDRGRDRERDRVRGRDINRSDRSNYFTN